MADFPKDARSFLVTQLCAGHSGGEDFFPKFRAMACQYEGVADVLALAAGEDGGGYRPGKVFVSAPIRFLDEVVGELQVFIEVEAFRDSSPLPLTRFLAKQAGIALQGVALQVTNQVLKDRLAALEAEVNEHKLMERALGVIQTRKLIPPGTGERLLKKASEESGRDLREIARNIVSTANKNPWKFRREFWA